MRKMFCHNSLRYFHPRRRRSAFTLAELVVSIGVLVLMFSLAGQVFTLTVKSTGQATALSEISQQLRMFEQTLRDDLRHVQPGRSVMVIQGNPVNAYWTDRGREADDNADPADGYPHVPDPAREDASGNLVAPRADILMFVTARSSTSYVFPDVSSKLQQVVYGHADLGNFVPDPAVPLAFKFLGPDATKPATMAFPQNTARAYPDPALPSPIPAARWHLARRGVLIMPGNNRISGVDLGDADRLLNVTDVLPDVSFSSSLQVPFGVEPWFLPFALRDPLSVSSGPDRFDLAAIARSQLDPVPPVQHARNLGHYFLPGCASFKVEWALDARSEFVAGRLEGTKEILWIDQGYVDDKGGPDPLWRIREAADAAPTLDLRARLQSLRDGKAIHPDGLPAYSMENRFGKEPTSIWRPLAPDGRPNLVVFGAKRRNFNTGEIVPEDVFPSLLRVTVDMYDDGDRLDRPIRHVMVLPVGG